MFIKVNGCGLWVLEKIRCVSGGFRGNFLVSVVFSSDAVLVWGVFDVFLGLLWVSLGFPWSSGWKSVNCGFWRTSGRLRGTLGLDSWYLGFLLFFGLILFFLGLFLTCFGVSVGFRCVLVSRKYKWEWIVGFGEDQVTFG